MSSDDPLPALSFWEFHGTLLNVDFYLIFDTSRLSGSDKFLETASLSKAILNFPLIIL